MATNKKPGDASNNASTTTKEYKYTQEISQMVLPFSQIISSTLILVLQMFVFGEVQEPLPETVNLVEDIVRGQLIELVRIYPDHVKLNQGAD
jgi:transcription initiation protein SPT3